MNPNAKPYVPGSWNVSVPEFKPSGAPSPATTQQIAPTEQPAVTEPAKEEINQPEVKPEQQDNSEINSEKDIPEDTETIDQQPAETTGQQTTETQPTAVQAEVKEQEVEVLDQRDHLNIIFIGHVDAGKSTISGNILYLTGQVDKRTIEKYEREAKEKNRGSWFLAYIMDTNEEERAKGKTVEVGKAYFATEKRRFTILDAPGHKAYVPNMIGGAAQADVGVLVISARKGEFEAGFERGGQTREHAMIAKTIGIRQLIVVINKMDEYNWGRERYDEIMNKISLFLKKECQYMPKDVTFLPISGFSGANLLEPLSKEVCPWFEGKSLIQTLESLPPPDRPLDAPVRMPITDRYKDMGLLNLLGRVEAGTIVKGTNLLLMPNRNSVKVQAIYVNDLPVPKAPAGENVRVAVPGLEDSDVLTGFVLCDPVNSIHVVSEFVAQLLVVELLPTNPLFTAGYQAVMHIHTSEREVTVVELLCEFDKKTKKPLPKKTTFVKAGALVNARLQTASAVCIELFENYNQLGRFTLRDKGKTIAIGKVIKI